MFFLVLCRRRKQLSEYLPPSVVKQKKKSSIVPPVSHKPSLLGIIRFTGCIVQRCMTLCQILVVGPVLPIPGKTSSLNCHKLKRFIRDIRAALNVPLVKLFQGCCLAGAQQPGEPKEVLWAPKFLQQLPKHYLLGS